MYDGLFSHNKLHSTGDYESLMFVDGRKNKMLLNRLEAPESSELLELDALIYPNPSHSQSRLRIDHKRPNSQIKCEIYNDIGKLIWSQTIIKNSEHIEEILLPTELSAGIYSVIIASESERLTKKYIKM